MDAFLVEHHATAATDEAESPSFADGPRICGSGRVSQGQRCVFKHAKMKRTEQNRVKEKKK